MKVHEKYLKRCIQLSKNGLVAAMPNPSVGAVIVFENRIIAEGYTSAYGGNHAEVNAIHSVIDKSILSKSTLYVSLEPCSHFGKTPPCSDLIIQYKIPNVVIGAVDSNEKVAGKGIQKLKDAGVNVIIGVLEADCKAANKRFFTFHEKKRPYIILKWAQSADGFIAPKTKNEQKPVWISNPYSRQLAHKWRSEVQAILVGTQTVIDDNPKLDVRDWTGINPIRIVLDKNNRIPKESIIFDNCAKTIVISEANTHFDVNLAKQIANLMFKNNLQSVIVEGGKLTLQTFIDSDLWDEARIFKSDLLLHDGLKAPNISGKKVTKSQILNDELLIYSNHD